MELPVSRWPSCWATAADLKSDCAAWARCFLNVGTVEENKRENVIEVWLKCHRADVGLWRRESSWLLVIFRRCKQQLTCWLYREAAWLDSYSHTAFLRSWVQSDFYCKSYSYSVFNPCLKAWSKIHTHTLTLWWMLQGKLRVQYLQHDHRSSGIRWPSAC